MKQEISFEEKKRIQLEMLDEVDAFCRANNIKYSIAFGTLLGAIRHKGFIPWDDDVDIMMPLPDLLKFKATFKSEITEYLDIDVNNQYDFAFSRLVYKKTYKKISRFIKGYGICIDLYVIIGIPHNYNPFFIDYMKLNDRMIRFSIMRSRAMRYLQIKRIPKFTKIIKDCRDYFFKKSVDYRNARKYYIIAGLLELREKMIYDKDLFSSTCDIQFEDRTYQAISEWDYFLRLRYGNYMELPPEDQRHPYHGGHYYYK